MRNFYPELDVHPMPGPASDYVEPMSSLSHKEQMKRRVLASESYDKWVNGATIKERAARYEAVCPLMKAGRSGDTGPFWTLEVGRAFGIEHKKLDKVIGEHIFGRWPLFRYWNCNTYPNAFRVDYIPQVGKFYAMNEMGFHILIGLIPRIRGAGVKIQNWCQWILEDACHFHGWKPSKYKYGYSESEDFTERDLIEVIIKEIGFYTASFARGRKDLVNFIVPTREIA